MAIVYRHIRLDKNEPFYIGIGLEPKRAYTNVGRNPYWHRIVESTEWKVDILFEEISWEDACNKEKEFIELYGRKNLNKGPLVNMTDGGDGVYGLEQDKKLLDRLSYINSGDKNPMWGKKHTKESRDKMGVNKGRKFHISDEERQRRLEVKNTNKRIKEIRKEMEASPDITKMMEVLRLESYVKSIKKDRMKRYDRVKRNRTQNQI